MTSAPPPAARHQHAHGQQRQRRGFGDDGKEAVRVIAAVAPDDIATTHGSSLNRTSLRRCTTMMGHLLTAILQVWIDRGADEDWGPMCYPPIGTPG